MTGSLHARSHRSCGHEIRQNSAGLTIAPSVPVRVVAQRCRVSEPRRLPLLRQSQWSSAPHTSTVRSNTPKQPPTPSKGSIPTNRTNCKLCCSSCLPAATQYLRRSARVAGRKSLTRQRHTTTEEPAASTAIDSRGRRPPVPCQEPNSHEPAEIRDQTSDHSVEKMGEWGCLASADGMRIRGHSHDPPDRSSLVPIEQRKKFAPRLTS